MIGAAQRGQPFAFETLVGRYEYAVLHLALQVTGSPRDASLIYQRTFLDLQRQLPSLATDGSLQMRVYSLAAERTVEFLEKRRETGRAGGTRLHGLAPRERVVFVLKHYHGLTMEAIGAILDISPDLVRNTLLDALRKLRHELNKRAGVSTNDEQDSGD